MTRSRCLLVALAAGSVFALPALAGPWPALTAHKKSGLTPAAAKARASKNGGGGVAAIPFNDNFDSYPVGQGVDGKGTWQLWNPASPDGVVVNTQANSKPNALELQSFTDVVQSGNVTGGVWEVKTMTYFPASSLGQGGGMLIGLNTWAFPAGPYNWSFDIGLDYATAPGMVACIDDLANTTPTTLVTDAWVPLTVTIDLGADTYDAFYNGVQIVNDRSWTQGASTNGKLAIECIDFYSSGVTGMLYDDVSLQQVTSCYPDCDGDNVLSIDDFVCFQTFFAFGSDYADCDGDNVLSIDDFICFQTFFAIGCP